MYGFQASAFQNSAFQTDILTGGSSGYDAEAFSDAYLKFRRQTDDKTKAPEKVLEVIKEVAQSSVEESTNKKDRGKILRQKIRGIDVQVNTLYVQMLEGLIQQYLTSLADLELERKRRDEEDLAVIMLLLS